MVIADKMINEIDPNYVPYDEATHAKNLDTARQQDLERLRIQHPVRPTSQGGGTGGGQGGRGAVTGGGSNSEKSVSKVKIRHEDKLESVESLIAKAQSDYEDDNPEGALAYLQSIAKGLKINISPDQKVALAKGEITIDQVISGGSPSAQPSGGQAVTPEEESLIKQVMAIDPSITREEAIQTLRGQ
jgi:hypothetical protein